MPAVVVASLVALAVLHFIRVVVLSPNDSVRALLTFAFIPARFSAAGVSLPGGIGAQWWSFLTYAFLHADITHLLMNSIWLAAFGSPLARRFGAARFLLLTLAGAVVGAATFLAFHLGEAVPVIGASAAVSAQMAAAGRFVFSAGGPLGQGRAQADLDSYHLPATPLLGLLADSRFLGFVGVWFAVNLAVGLIGLGEGQTVAWEAHMGGFAAGLLLFPLLDPVGNRRF